jgi:nicotinamide-nucleotide adenylyltransferase
VQAVLRDAGVDSGSLSIVPLPINLPHLYIHYVPMDAVFFLTIYDAWGRKKRDQFQELGLKTEVLWQKPPEQKGIRGTHVRALMALEEPWDHLVPPATARLMRQWRIPQRLQKLAVPKP